MTTHPYPVELEELLELRDGTRLELRPMRPEDAEREDAFVAALSERSRYQRFMQHLPRLTPSMLERFTHPDYDRELALVVLDGGRFVAVGRYAPTIDAQTAEFAITVLDEFQRRGLGHALLERLCKAAKAAGYRAIEGHVLHENRDMLELASHLGFATQAVGAGDVTVVRRL